MSTVKTRHHNARETARVLAGEYTHTYIDTIVCLDDNKIRMIENKQVLILAASITTGKTILKAAESVLYYGGKVCGVAGIFSAVSRIADMEVKSIFTSADLPDYKAYTPQSCPMCREGKRVEALVNSYGYSKL